MSNFPTFHCHPSSFDSASTPQEMAKREVELGSGALTCTDHGSLGGCRTVYDLATAKGLTPILGIEGYFRDDKCPILLAAGEDPAKWLKYTHVTLHALDQEAYYALVKATSLAPLERHGSEIKPIWGWRELEALGAYNITVGSGCLVGMVSRHLLSHGRRDIAHDYYQRLRSIFRPGNFYAEVFPHRCTHNWVEGVFFDVEGVGSLKYYPGKKLSLLKLGEMTASDIAKRAAKQGLPEGERLLAVKDRHKWVEVANSPLLLGVKHIEDFIENECLPWHTSPDVQDACNRVVLEFAREFGDPVVISDDSHYAHPEDKVVQDIKLMQHGAWRFYGHYNRLDNDGAWGYFAETGASRLDFDRWVENNHAWASRFRDFRLVEPVSLPTQFYPSDTLAHTMDLIRRHGRMDWKNPEYVKRLKAEIDILKYNGKIDLLPYFFLGEDVCRAYSDRGLLTGPGRGSAAGLLLAYLLEITHVDPLRYGLSLERFLTKDRVLSGKMPDIDQDLPGRELLVDEQKVRVARVTLDTGEKIEVPLDGYVKTADGAVATVRRALEEGLDVADWGVDARCEDQEVVDG